MLRLSFRIFLNTNIDSFRKSMEIRRLNQSPDNDQLAVVNNVVLMKQQKQLNNHMTSFRRDQYT